MPTPDQLTSALDAVLDPVSGLGLLTSGRAAAPRGVAPRPEVSRPSPETGSRTASSAEVS